MAKGVNGHHSARAKTVDWLTPPDIVKRLGPFDLDPCASLNQPWPTARVHYTIKDNGLLLPFFGRVFLNPPYGKETKPWLARLAEHMNGIALIFNRSETAFFFEEVWDRAGGILFIKKRLHFHYPDGRRAKKNSGGPSVLLAYGRENVWRLRRSGIEGYFIRMTETTAYMIAPNVLPFVRKPCGLTWREIVDDALAVLGGRATVAEICRAVRELYAWRVARAKHWRPKVRQTLQFHFRPAGKWTWERVFQPQIIAA